MRIEIENEENNTTNNES